MPRRYVLALVKHETNTFSPIDTPLSSFGHGEGPAFGHEVVDRFRGTNTPLAAYLDLAAREHAEIVTPVAAVHRVPVLGAAVRFAEHRLADLPFARELGGFLVAVAQRR